MKNDTLLLLRSLVSDLGGQQSFARLAKVSQAAVSKLLRGENQPSPVFCIAIERLSAGQIRRSDLRADWAAIWPEFHPPKLTAPSSA